MKRLIYILLLLCVGTAAAQETAYSFFKKTIDKIKSERSISASCTINHDGTTEAASLIMGGKSFKIESPAFSVWYDGKTQWTYSADTEEVNITEPSEAELAEINPLVVLDQFLNNYSVSYGNYKDGLKSIVLVSSRKNNDIISANIGINDKTMMPVMINLKFSNGANISIYITNIKFGDKLPSSIFRYNKSIYPDAEIIDLR